MSGRNINRDVAYTNRYRDDRIVLQTREQQEAADNNNNGEIQLLDKYFYGEKLPLETDPKNGPQAEFIGPKVFRGVINRKTVIHVVPKWREEGLPHGNSSLPKRTKRGLLMGHFKRIKTHTTKTTFGHNKFGMIMFRTMHNKLVERKYKAHVVTNAIKNALTEDEFEIFTEVMEMTHDKFITLKQSTMSKFGQS